MANSKKKGSRGERMAVQVLKDWTGKEFSRVPQSGGLGWKNRDFSSGDIMCTKEGHFFPFSVECKNYKDINFEHLLYLDNAKILDFWTQCLGDAQRAKKLPFLMIRYDRLPKGFFFIFLDLSTFEYIQQLIPNFDLERALWVKTKTQAFVILTTNDLKNIPYKTIRKPLKKLVRP
jgi:Holliday junction resolvase